MVSAERGTETSRRFAMDRPVVIPGAKTFGFAIAGFRVAAVRGGGRLAALLAVFMFIVAGDPLRRLFDMVRGTSLPTVPTVTAVTLTFALMVFVFAGTRFGSAGSSAVVLAAVYTWILRRPPELSDSAALLAGLAFAGLFVAGTV